MSKDGDENILRTDVWKELRILDDIIQNTTVEYDGEVFSYRQICARWEEECFTNDILNLDYILPDVESGNISLSWPIMLNPVSWDGKIIKLVLTSFNCLMLECFHSSRISRVLWRNESE